MTFSQYVKLSMEQNLLKTFIFILASIHLSSGLYFHIGETEKKCFIEEIPDETTVLVNYEVELFDQRSGGFIPSTEGFGMHMEVKDPDMKTILSMVYSAEGRISFTSNVPGDHVICLYSNSTKWFGDTQLRVHLNIQVGEHAIDYFNVAQKGKLSNLQLRMRHLLDQVDAITKEQNYQRYLEDRFRRASETTNQTVFWWSTAQLIILVCMVAWQLKHLKSIFEAEKYSDDFELRTDELEKSKELSCDSAIKNQFNPNNPGKFCL